MTELARVYLDNAATTAVDPQVAAAMCACLTRDGNFANPASHTHHWGLAAADAVENARAEVSLLTGAAIEEIVFSSGATEANNLAILGVAQRFDTGHMISIVTEHKAVLDPLAQLRRQGWRIDLLPVGADGLVDLDVLQKAIAADTRLISVMQVNNEIGVVQDVTAIGAIARARGVLLHVDAAQSAGKLPLDMHAQQIDLLSICAHKFHGPKGVGALCVRRRPPLRIGALMHGGGHERGLRPGTLPTHQLVGLGEACKLARESMATEVPRIAALRDALWQELQQIPGVLLNGSIEHRVSGNLNISVEGVEGESLVAALQHIGVSSGSACTSASLEPSHVLRALGCTPEQAQASLRISFGRFNVEADVVVAAADIRQAIQRLRQMAPSVAPS